MSDQQDVLFVVLDSVRKDRVSLFGHDRETTPALDALARRATVFENAYAPAHWTLPSHASMFSGRYPSEHGATTGFADRTTRLPAGLETLAEGLSDVGYRTAGFSNNPWVGRLTGLDRGFDEFVEWDLEISSEAGAPIHTGDDRRRSRWHTWIGRAAKQPAFLLKRPFFTASLVERASRWVETTATDPAPTFTFLNLMEAHSPYFPPADAFRALDIPPPSSRLEPRLLNTRLLAYVLGRADLDPDRRERVLQYYDAALRYQDAKLHDLLETLAAVDTFEETLVIVCSDHGKTLGEFDRSADPVHYVRDVTTNVPLVVKHPGQREGSVIADPAELGRLPGMIRENAPARTLRSDDGYALIEEDVPHTGRTETPVTRWRVLTDGEEKYVRNERGEEFLLRGTAADERVVAGADERLDRVRGRLDGRIDGLRTHSRDDATDTTEIGRRIQSNLEDLGYL
ncbi:sulfatase [Natronorarus salvus]|uniref:sulfatase n=1 Tax=Natronorarus salvus TaxID=3117733 RepID=UPI002F261496